MKYTKEQLIGRYYKAFDALYQFVDDETDPNVIGSIFFGPYNGEQHAPKKSKSYTIEELDSILFEVLPSPSHYGHYHLLSYVNPCLSQNKIIDYECY